MHAFEKTMIPTSFCDISVLLNGTLTEHTLGLPPTQIIVRYCHLLVSVTLVLLGWCKIRCRLYQVS